MSDKLLVRVIGKVIPQPKKPVCDFKRKPFNHVTIKFKAPLNNLKVMVMRKTDTQNRWTTIGDNVKKSMEVVDANPPKTGKASYAILYKTDNGNLGPLSNSETIELR